MQRVKSKSEVKDVVFPHSQAKLDLYNNYLLTYLKVLGLSVYCSKINLFDIFCGMGLYDDGNIGSPLITNKCIAETNNLISGFGKPNKPISVHINDYKIDKIENVKSILDNDKHSNCIYNYYNEDADNMLDIASKLVNSFATSERNLVFIDPYGYSHIQRNKILDLIKNEHTEIILFLPIMQMYRFKDIAINNLDRACYENLRRFIFSFFPPSHKIHNDKIESVFEFIHEIKRALSFNSKFYTCSHYIERGKGNYYALFFITSNIYGLDKMVEAKWKLDPIQGKGYTQKKHSNQMCMFTDQFEEIDNERQIDFLKSLILAELKDGRIVSNKQIYKLTLVSEFRPTHAKTVLEQLLKENKIYSCSPFGEKKSQTISFYLDYTNYKNGTNMIYFKKS